MTKKHEADTGFALHHHTQYSRYCYRQLSRRPRILFQQATAPFGVDGAAKCRDPAATTARRLQPMGCHVQGRTPRCFCAHAMPPPHVPSLIRFQQPVHVASHCIGPSQPGSLTSCEYGICIGRVLIVVIATPYLPTYISPQILARAPRNSSAGNCISLSIHRRKTLLTFCSAGRVLKTLSHIRSLQQPWRAAGSPTTTTMHMQLTPPTSTPASPSSTPRPSPEPVACRHPHPRRSHRALWSTSTSIQTAISSFPMATQSQSP